jgi:hypothetical protein
LAGSSKAISGSGKSLVGDIPGDFHGSDPQEASLGGISPISMGKVFCKSGGHTADKTLAYLAQYVHQTAITNSRILHAENGKITFRYKDSREHRWKTMTLDTSQFMRCFLQHVLPRGFHKVRYYGLLSPCNRQRLDPIRRTLNQNSPTPEQEPQEPKDKS